MIELRELTRDEFEAQVAEAGVALPIEQTGAWMDLESSITDRTFWGHVAFVRDGQPLGWASFADYLTHGYHYLRSHHGPVWVRPLGPDEEREALRALAAFVRKRDRRQAFVRLAVQHELDLCRPTLSITPYDETVVMDLSGGEDDILSRMKTRGRRDVRKALRESPATYADETALASSSFDEYYDVMVETAQRDGFTPAPKADYENMLRILGPNRCRVFAGRVDGQVVTWTIATVNDGHAVRYYGASRSDVPHRNFVTDGLIFFEALTLGAEGVADYDMMGIGSERYPGLSSLNTFKCKFAKDVVRVAPDRDLPVHRAFYGALCLAKRALDAVRERRSQRRKD
jgi:hypothetical protein